jgi:probable phosphoglycerate mutase
MQRLLLVRHAVTEHTGHKLSGWLPGLHLSDTGRGQAAALAERLRPVRIDAAYTSPLERCQETAKAVVEGRDLELRTLDEVGEVRYGDWTGRELKDLAKEKLWRVVQGHPSGARFPGGESIYEMQVRAVGAIEALRASPEHKDQTVLVASHADVIKAIAAHYLGLHLDSFQRLVVGPASLTAFTFTPFPMLTRLNETGDASDLNPPPPKQAEDPAEQETEGEAGRADP